MELNCGFLPYAGKMAEARRKVFYDHRSDMRCTAKGQVRYMDVMAREVNGKQMTGSG